MICRFPLTILWLLPLLCCRLKRLPPAFLFIIFLFSPSCHFDVSASLAATGGNETDRLSLLAFKNQIISNSGDYPSRLLLRSWNDSVHFCDWEGVSCGGRHQKERVTSLDLHSHALVGPISPYLANLTFLNNINLGYNYFRGRIPPEIGRRLFRLRYLNLTHNSLEGEIPANLSGCSQLEHIDLMFNKLVGRIPGEFSSLRNLISLSLSVNEGLTGSIPASFGNFSFLTRLSLARNGLVGNIPNDLGRLKTLRFLQISQNKLSGTIPSSIYNLSDLYMFSVTDNRLEGGLPRSLGAATHLPNLQMLFMAANRFMGEIPVSLSNASGLQEIWFSHNELTGAVPLNLGTLSALRILSLGGNQLGEGRVDDLNFISSLTNCTHLETLNIDINRFTGILPNSISNLSTQLDRLAVGGNRISGTIPAGIGNLVNLTLLSLDRNLLEDTIPVGIGKLSKLQVLMLSGNKLSGEIPTSIGNMTRLTELHLAENGLLGSIPSTLENCQNLLILNLSQNNLNGTIPVQVMSISSLSISLNLAKNSLTGPLPSTLGSLKNLGELDISDNKLFGEIPSDIGSCSSLEYLRLKGNFFQGTIPSSLSNLHAIRDVDLSDNNLSGHIPKYFEKFPILQNLNLSFNNFEGEVPKGGVFRNGTVVSLYGNKKLCGGISKLQLRACPTLSSKKHGRPLNLAIIIPIITVIVCTGILSGLYFARSWLKNSRKAAYFQSLSDDDDNYVKFLKVSYAVLHRATDGFSSSNLIGVGSFGSVYKGKLDQIKAMVAVKVLKLQQRGASRSFMAECEALRNIRHRNLVKILTSCSTLCPRGNEFKALVFELVPNGSLEKWLHPKVDAQNQLRSLSFRERLNIAINVASALDYLHHHCEIPIVHCDLKPSNVLLDGDMNAQVGDFGLARFLYNINDSSSRNQTSSFEMKGSIGYIAPEYGMGGGISTQGDVYSYGILLLEIFTGKRPTDDMFKDGLSLHKFASLALPHKLKEIIDPVLFEEEEEGNEILRKQSRIYDCLNLIIGIGVSCSAESPRDRMQMRDVSVDMQAIMDLFLGPDPVAHSKVETHKIQ